MSIKLKVAPDDVFRDLKMKQKVLALLLFAMTLVISSCSKEVDDKHLIGVWKCTNYKYEFFDGNGNLINSYDSSEGIDGEGFTIEFLSNGSFIEYYPEEHNDGTYTLKGKTLSLFYIVSAERLTCSIEQLTESSMSWKKEVRNLPYPPSDDAVFIERWEFEKLSD